MPPPVLRSSEPKVLRSGTEAELATFRWLTKRASLRLDEDFLFWPLLLGGINIGIIPVNFYIRAAIVGRPLGWRVRPRPMSGEKTRERMFIEAQHQQSTAVVIRIDDDEVLSTPNRVLRRALTGLEL